MACPQVLVGRENLSFILKESSCFLTQKELYFLSILQNPGELLIQYFNEENKLYTVFVRILFTVSFYFKKKSLKLMVM